MTIFAMQVFLLNVIDNLPRLRISNFMMKVFLWVLRESGARNVPSFDALRKLQKQLNSQSGISSRPHQSPQGNLFFINDPHQLIVHVSRHYFVEEIRLTFIQDFSNPLVRPYLQFYPEMPDRPITEIWHADKWRKDLNPANLAPMYDNLYGWHYYINELAGLKNGDLVILVRWVEWRGRV
jgi:hypothetical protein